MVHRWAAMRVGVGVVTLALAGWGCKSAPLDRPIKLGPVDTGPGSVEATRRALEGSWTLASLEVVDAGGARRPVKASGQLQYDAYGNMKVRGVIEDPALQKTLVLDYDGRIVIDTAKHQFYSENLVSERPVDPGQVAPIAPDKVSRYELSADAFVVTYVDASGNPTAVARWRR